MNTNYNNLKPGNRVRMTGWKTDVRKATIDEFENIFSAFPVLATFKKMRHIGHCFQIDGDPVGWSARIFKYEKIETDGSNE